MPECLGFDVWCAVKKAALSDPAEYGHLLAGAVPPGPRYNPTRAEADHTLRFVYHQVGRIRLQHRTDEITRRARERAAGDPEAEPFTPQNVRRPS